MTVEERFKERYKEGNTPWDIGQPDFNLVETVTARKIAPCQALDIGCGTGDNSIWLAQNKFSVIGIDASELAVGKAVAKAGEAKVQCDFRVLDFRTADVPDAPFGLVFDRGWFHTLTSDPDRKTFADKVAALLTPDGLWLSLLGNADEIRDRPGPPQRTAANIVLAVEPSLEILSLTSTTFGSNRQNPPRAWVCLMRKRSVS